MASGRVGVRVSDLMLAVDFGSSNTAAAYRDVDGRTHEVRLSSVSTLMPSAVLWSSERALVGQAALQAMLTDPGGFEPSPKRRLADREVFLGDALIAVTDLVAAVLAEVFARAERVLGRPPDRVVLTHPDKWGAGQQEQLASAAVQAGVARERITLVSEATAAAQFYTATGGALPVGARVAVCDFGAGTVDVAVLDKQPDGGFTVVAADGVEGLGGHDLDARVQAWVSRQLMLTDPALAAELDDPTDVAARLMLTDRIRDAKEALSEAMSASILARGAAGTRVLQLTRDEFDGLIAADVDRAVELTRWVLAEANTIQAVSEPPTLYLAGGTSAIPLVHSRLAELGSIETLGDPKTVVCQGALYAPAPSMGRAGTASPGLAPGPPTAVAPRPVQRVPMTPPPTRSVQPPLAPAAPAPPPQAQRKMTPQPPPPSALPLDDPKADRSIIRRLSPRQQALVSGGLFVAVMLSPLRPDKFFRNVPPWFGGADVDVPDLGYFSAPILQLVSILLLARGFKRRVSAFLLSAAAIGLVQFGWWAIDTGNPPEDDSSLLPSVCCSVAMFAFVAAWGIARRHNRLWLVGLVPTALLSPLIFLYSVFLFGFSITVLLVPSASFLICWGLDAYGTRRERRRSRV